MSSGKKNKCAFAEAIELIMSEEFRDMMGLTDLCVHYDQTNDDNTPFDITDSIFEDESDSPDEKWEYTTEMAGRISGRVKVRGKSKDEGLIIAMGADERDIEHFHVFRKDADKKAWKNSACLMLKDNSYYDHSDHKETLTKDELDAVIEKLKSLHPDLGITQWKYLVTLWNDNNERYRIEPNTPMPGYDFKTIRRYVETKKNSKEKEGN